MSKISLLNLRNHRGEVVEATCVAATEAKNEFGKLLESAMQGSFVVITKHGDAKAVLISVQEFNALRQAPATELNTLSGEFDALLERMQTPEARKRMEAAFGASPQDLGRAALRALR
jgi:prevent-host-death family protein